MRWLKINCAECWILATLFLGMHETGYGRRQYSRGMSKTRKIHEQDGENTLAVGSCRWTEDMTQWEHEGRKTKYRQIHYQRRKSGHETLYNGWWVISGLAPDITSVEMEWSTLTSSSDPVTCGHWWTSHKYFGSERKQTWDSWIIRTDWMAAKWSWYHISGR